MDATLPESTRAFARIGLLSFGGPAAQIALMHRILVEEKQWLTEKQYLGALNFCMLLPGPEAMQLATYAGWRLHGVLGGLIAGLLFVLPGAVVVLALAMLYAWSGDVPLVAALFIGIKAAVLIVVVEALLKVSRRALHRHEHWVIAGLAFVGIFFFQLPFPLIILAAAVFGFFRLTDSQSSAEPALPVDVRPARTLLICLIGLALWFAPLVLLNLMSDHNILVEVGAFFSKLAVVTFGGAYAVLAYMGQDVVEQFGWLSASEMMDGLGLAETTPGPLILVTEFVGFLAGYRAEGLGVALGAAVVTLWVTFVPCFIWIFAGAPYIEWLSAQPRLNSAMSAITAAVVGVILNLSLYFALHVLFRDVQDLVFGPLHVPGLVFDAIDWRIPPLSLLCAWLLLGRHTGITRVLLISSLLGLVMTVVM